MNNIKIPGNYQYQALNFGLAPQRFWHANKLLLLETTGKFKPTDIILDAGCGSGNIVIALSGRVKKAVGIDSNKEALNFAKERASKLKISRFLIKTYKVFLSKMIILTKLFFLKWLNT